VGIGRGGKEGEGRGGGGASYPALHSPLEEKIKTNALTFLPRGLTEKGKKKGR